MPYMHVSLTKVLTPAERQTLYDKLGEALTLVPGTQARLLIAEIDDGKQLFCGGTLQKDFVFIDARYHGKYEYSIREAFVKAVFRAVQEVVGTPEANISMNLSELTAWGGFGNYLDDAVRPAP